MAEYCGVKWNGHQFVNMLDVISAIYPKYEQICKLIWK